MVERKISESEYNLKNSLRMQVHIIPEQNIKELKGGARV